MFKIKYTLPKCSRSEIYPRVHHHNIISKRIHINTAQHKPPLNISKQNPFTQSYRLKSTAYQPVIPLNLFQTWRTKNLPPNMRKVVNKLKQDNPEFNYFLYDDNDCREFIARYFEEDVLMAFDTLIPGAYKADLWRYCVLYIEGGIYLDIKLQCVNGFKLMELTEKDHHLAMDRVGPVSIYNAVMASQPKHPFLLMAIQQIVKNVKSLYYGISPLCPTGPLMLGELILKHRLKLNIDLTHYIDGGFVTFKNRFVLSTEYPEYARERNLTFDETNSKRYNELWDDKTIYIQSL